MSVQSLLSGSARFLYDRILVTHGNKIVFCRGKLRFPLTTATKYAKMYLYCYTYILYGEKYEGKKKEQFRIDQTVFALLQKVQMDHGVGPVLRRFDNFV